MSIVTELPALLKTLCARSFPGFAPVSTERPYVTFQLLGGPALRYADNLPADKRMSFVQINVWASSALDAAALAWQIEEAMCASPVFTASVEGEIVTDFDADVPVYGTRQDFKVLSNR